MSKLLELFIKLTEWLRSAYVVKHTEIVSEEIFKNPAWMSLAYKEIGTKEIRNGENPRIVEYHMATSLKATDDETPWCSSFVCWVLERSNIKSTRNAWARSYMTWGKSLSDPKFGCIVVFKRGDAGHVGFFVDQHKDSIMVLGGNQSNEVNISEYSKDNLLGYRWPEEIKG